MIGTYIRTGIVTTAAGERLLVSPDGTSSLDASMIGRLVKCDRPCRYHVRNVRPATRLDRVTDFIAHCGRFTVAAACLLWRSNRGGVV